jgi:hypothetical protein
MKELIADAEREGALDARSLTPLEASPAGDRDRILPFPI